jgi:hypothetical protein
VVYDDMVGVLQLIVYSSIKYVVAILIYILVCKQYDDDLDELQMVLEVLVLLDEADEVLDMHYVISVVLSLEDLIE